MEANEILYVGGEERGGEKRREMHALFLPTMLYKRKTKGAM